LTGSLLLLLLLPFTRTEQAQLMEPHAIFIALHACHSHLTDVVFPNAGGLSPTGSSQLLLRLPFSGTEQAQLMEPHAIPIVLHACHSHLAHPGFPAFMTLLLEGGERQRLRLPTRASTVPTRRRRRTLSFWTLWTPTGMLVSAATPFGLARRT
jgi:hypothetical protein